MEKCYEYFACDALDCPVRSRTDDVPCWEISHNCERYSKGEFQEIWKDLAKKGECLCEVCCSYYDKYSPYYGKDKEKEINIIPTRQIDEQKV